MEKPPLDTTPNFLDQELAEMDKIMAHKGWRSSCICCGRYRNEIKPAICSLLLRLLDKVEKEILNEWHSPKLDSAGAAGAQSYREQVLVKLASLRNQLGEKK